MRAATVALLQQATRPAVVVVVGCVAILLAATWLAPRPATVPSPPPQQQQQQRDACDACVAREGRIDDCCCAASAVRQINEAVVAPALASLVVSDALRFVKINLNVGCPLWPNEGVCFTRSCAVYHCNEDEVPALLRARGAVRTRGRAAVTPPRCQSP